MKTIKENRQIKMSITFKDETGALAAPSKVIYTLHDIITGTLITASTEVIPSSSTVVITITAEENRILNDHLDYEDKKFSFTWYSGTDLLGTEDFVYRVENLENIPI